MALLQLMADLLHRNLETHRLPPRWPPLKGFACGFDFGGDDEHVGTVLQVAVRTCVVEVEAVVVVELVLAAALELGLVDLVEDDLLDLAGGDCVLDDAKFVVIDLGLVCLLNLPNVDFGRDD